MGRNKKITAEQVKPLIKEEGGNLAAIARELKVGRSTVQRRIDENGDLQELVADQRQRSIDKAEKALEEKIDEGNLTAIIFKLKTQGKNRGYSQRQEISGPGGGPIKSKNKEEVSFDAKGQADNILEALESKRTREDSNKEDSE